MMYLKYLEHRVFSAQHDYDFIELFSDWVYGQPSIDELILYKSR